MALGDRLYGLVHALQPSRAGKITGMLLETGEENVHGMIEDPGVLASAVGQALDALKEANIDGTDDLLAGTDGQAAAAPAAEAAPGGQLPGFAEAAEEADVPPVVAPVVAPPVAAPVPVPEPAEPTASFADLVLRDQADPAPRHAAPAKTGFAFGYTTTTAAGAGAAAVDDVHAGEPAEERV